MNVKARHGFRMCVNVSLSACMYVRVCVRVNLSARHLCVCVCVFFYQSVCLHVRVFLGVC